MRLNIPSGTAVRFEPGQQRTVELVDYAGDRQVYRISRPGAGSALMATIGRRAYAEMYGPTVGDRVRLADTDLLIEVEHDHTLRAGSHGEEVKFGGGKVIRDGMGQSQRSNGPGRRRRGRLRDHQCADRRPLGHRQGRHRPARQPHREDRQGRQSRMCRPASTSSSGRAPK